MKILKASLFFVALLFISSVAVAQNTVVSGTIVNKDSKKPIVEATVSISALRIITSTDEQGIFKFNTDKTGTFDVVISTDGFNEFHMGITIGEGQNTLPTIELDALSGILNVPIPDNAGLSMEDAASDDGAGMASGQNVASILNASRDPFLSAASFGWGSYFFSIRGLEGEQHEQYLNGIPMNDLENGRVSYNSYSGLNDVFRGRTFGLGLQANEYAFGGYGLNSYIDASASTQRAQTRVSYASTNRNYRNRLMLTHSSGLNKKGWAYSFSLSRRWAEQGPIKGTYYNAYGYYAAVEKKHKNHNISLMAFGAPIERGKNGPTTAEAFDLAGTTYYNPYWGYQNGEVRNSRVFKMHMPMFILSDKWNVNKNTKVMAAVSYQKGESSTTTFDWYNAADPRPDYYRYLPSWEGIDKQNPALEQQLRDKIMANPEEHLQVNWDRIYGVNYFNQRTGDGRASYILGADVKNSRKISSNINVQHIVNDHITLNAGAIYQNQHIENYRRVEDLLGSNYWLNINQFAERDFKTNPNISQLDLNNPNQKKVVGDTYGYNYDMNFRNIAFFTQAVFKYNRVDFFVSHEIRNNVMQRVGNYKSGLYPNNSFGESDQLDFNTNRSKAGATFKINGRNYIYANGAVGTKAPFADDMFVSSRTRNQIVQNPRVERIRSAEVGYLLRSPNFKGRITGYVTESKDGVDIKRYFNDDAISFANMVLQGVSKRSTGIEIGSAIKLSPSFTLNLAANLGQAFYTSRVSFNEYIDNDTLQQISTTLVPEYDTAYIANFHVPKGPQTAFQANLFYRSPKYWFGSVTLNYMGGKWLDIAPTARSVEGVGTLDRNSAEYIKLIAQERVEPYFTLGAFAGKSFKLNKYFDKASNNMFLFVNLGLNNILDQRDIMLYGFENLRQGTVRTERLRAFDNRFAHSLGFQYYLNIAFTF